MIKEKMLSVVDPKLLKEVMVLQKKSMIPREEVITLSYDCLDATDAELTGGKGSSLCVLNCVRGVDVPLFFCVTTNAFKEMIRSNKILNFVEALEELSEKWRTASDQEKPKIEEKFIVAVKDLRKQIVETEMGSMMKNKISEAYFNLCEGTGVEKNKLSVAVRSSATTEDRIDASFAGMHDTYLNQRGVEHVLHSVKKCWASVFTYRASKYRMTKNISHLEAHVSVVIQQMCFPKVAGTSFTIEIGTSYPGIHIAACYGLGEALVSGEVTSDEWLLHPETLLQIKRVYGSKRIQYKILEGGKSGIKKLEEEMEGEEEEDGKKESKDENEYSLDNDMIQHIAETTKRIGQVYKQLFGYEYVDTEFAVSEDSKLYLLQCRPVVPVIWDKIMTVDTETPDIWSKVILKGKYSLLGSVHGKAKVITDFQDLVDGNTSIEAEDILITYKTSNYWNQYLTNLKGIVTMEGSPTAHPMLIGRERKIPCVIGCEDVIKVMKPHHGAWITLDGVKKCLFIGKVPLKEISGDELLLSQFEVVPKGGYVPTKSRLVSNGRAISFDGDSEKLWVKNKLFKLCKVTQEWTQKCFEMREQIIYEACKGNPGLVELKKKEILNFMSHESLVKDDYVYDRYTTLTDAMGIFEGLGLEECKLLHQDYVDTQNRIVRLGNEFDLSDPEKWNEFGTEFSRLIAHMWLSFCFRKYVNQKVRDLSNELLVSKFHLDQFQHHIQSQEVEEDNLCRRAILEVALSLLKFSKNNKSVVKLEDVTVEMLFDSSSDDQFKLELLNQLTKLTKNFKLTIIADFYLDLPLKTCLNKAKAAVKEFGDEPEEKLKQLLGMNNREKEVKLSKYFKEMEYFPEEEDYCEWVKLGIQARIQHCNAHHKRLRSQWNVKEKLLEMKKKKEKDIFWVCSHKDIFEMIKAYKS